VLLGLFRIISASDAPHVALKFETLYYDPICATTLSKDNAE